jgi:hypothetical protein
MPNRNQNFQWGRGRDEYGRGQQRFRDDDNGYPRSEEGRDYGSYTENDEGESSMRAGAYDQGREQRDRYSGYGNFGQGDYSRQGAWPGQGEGRYAGGQGGYRGGTQEPNYGYGRGGRQQEPRYGREAGSSGTSMYGRSFSDYGYSGGSGWNEPYGEGQQYTSRGDYGGQYGSGTGERMGEHRGKGPKGYQRSDDRIKELICERLHDDPHIDPSDVTISVQGGKVTLEGTVDSRQTKNAIEDVAEQFGTQEVQNNLRVQRSSQAGESGSRAAGKSATEENEKGGKQRH